MTEDAPLEAAANRLSRASAQEIRNRLFRGEHVSLAADYLDGRLDYSPDDWEVAALISLALKHHFAVLNRAGQLKVDVLTEQVGDGLAITVRWPDDRAIDEVKVSFELIDDTGDIRFISRSFGREMVAGNGFGRIFGKSLASDQTVVLRPIRAAATVSATAVPSHRLRFNDRSLAPSLRSCFPDGEVVARQDFEFDPLVQIAPSVIDVYREARGREVLEIISIEEQRDRERQARAQRRKAIRRRIVRIAAATALVSLLLLGALLLFARFVPGVPSWFPFTSTESVGAAPSSPDTSSELPAQDSPNNAKRQANG